MAHQFYQMQTHAKPNERFGCEWVCKPLANFVQSTIEYTSVSAAVPIQGETQCIRDLSRNTLIHICRLNDEEDTRDFVRTFPHTNQFQASPNLLHIRSWDPYLCNKEESCKFLFAHILSNDALDAYRIPSASFESWDFGPKIGLDGLAQVWTPLPPDALTRIE